MQDYDDSSDFGRSLSRTGQEGVLQLNWPPRVTNETQLKDAFQFLTREQPRFITKLFTSEHDVD